MSGAIWHIGMSGPLNAADPGSIPDESNALFSEIWIPTFQWAYNGWIQSFKLKPYCLHIPLNRTQIQRINTPIVVTPLRWSMHKVINSGNSHTYQCPPKSYTARLRQVSEASITAQSVQPQGEIPEEGRRKIISWNVYTIKTIYILF